MKIDKPSIVLAYTGWISMFIEGWLLLLRKIPADGLSWAFFALFFFLGVMASAVYAGKPKATKPDIRVRIGAEIFSEEKQNLQVVQTPAGGILLCVVKPENYALLPLDKVAPYKILLLAAVAKIAKYLAWQSEIGDQKAQVVMNEIQAGKYGSQSGVWVQTDEALEHIAAYAGVDDIHIKQASTAV